MVKAARVRSSVDLTLQPNTPYVPSFDVITYDTGGFFNAQQPERLTIPEDGLYMLGASVIWEFTPANSDVLADWGIEHITRRVILAYDGVHLRPLHNWRASLCTQYGFQAGDQILVFGNHTHDSPLRWFAPKVTPQPNPESSGHELATVFWIHKVA